MPGGTVSFNGGATQVRFVSVHTTSPTNDYWQQWKRSLDELAKLRFDTSRRYVFMGDFNATYDHTPFRNILGNRFSDASRQAGEGLKFSWPANVDYVPSFAGIDHIVLDSGMQAGQVRTVKVDGSDHKDDVRALRFCGQHRHGELVEQLVGERSGQLSYRIRVRQPFHNRGIWYVLHADPLVFQR